ncbi:hypothetical protein [Roseibium sp.]|uniref:hypothetical protein n=1 Tax=Roseibium sp. TaxID=1936156 RepID=UPI003B50B30B
MSKDDLKALSAGLRKWKAERVERLADAPERWADTSQLVRHSTGLGPPDPEQPVPGDWSDPGLTDDLAHFSADWVARHPFEAFERLKADPARAMDVLEATLEYIEQGRGHWLPDSEAARVMDTLGNCYNAAVRERRAEGAATGRAARSAEAAEVKARVRDFAAEVRKEKPGISARQIAAEWRAVEIEWRRGRGQRDGLLPDELEAWVDGVPSLRTVQGYLKGTHEKSS